MKWDPNECESLGRAFEALRESGVLAEADFECCKSCAMGAIDEKLDSGNFDGYVFYHEQDRERAMSSGSMHLGFGDADEEGSRSVEIGQRVCAALRDAGLATTWDGTAGRAIRVYGPGVKPPPAFTCACCENFNEAEPHTIRVGSSESKVCESCARLPRDVVRKLIEGKQRGDQP